MLAWVAGERGEKKLLSAKFAKKVGLQAALAMRAPEVDNANRP
jgi:hypothetical protein